MTTTKEDITMMDHHPLSPSNWPAWFHCGGYRGADRDTKASSRGTNVHKAFEQMITERNKQITRNAKRRGS